MSKQNTAAVQPKAKITLDPRFTAKLTLTLMGICAVVALLLGIVNNMTEPIIEEIQAEKTAAAMSQVLPADNYEKVETTYPNVTALHKAMSGGEQVGYVVEVTASGFGGTLSMVVGVDMDGAVTGVSVTDNSETANIGTKVVNDQSVLDRFIGKSHADGEITVNSGSNRFDGVSGATVSSKGVTAGVNTALSAVAEQEGGEA